MKVPPPCSSSACALAGCTPQVRPVLQPTTCCWCPSWPVQLQAAAAATDAAAESFVHLLLQHHAIVDANTWPARTSAEPARKENKFFTDPDCESAKEIPCRAPAYCGLQQWTILACWRILTGWPTFELAAGSADAPGWLWPSGQSDTWRRRRAAGTVSPVRGLQLELELYLSDWCAPAS